MEDEDLYRFNRDVSQWLGVPITRVSMGMTPWEYFKRRGRIADSAVPICSIEMKRELLDEWRCANTMELTTTLHVGIDWTEEHRLHRLRKELPTWRVEAPMCEPPLWDKCKMLDELRKVGIEPPRLYALGFPHNNCGGFCVKAGQAHFAHLLRVMPERYAWHEAQEEEARAVVGDFSVLKDRRGDGKKKTMTLRQFRERIEAGEDFDRNDWGGCGCGMSNPDLVNSSGETRRDE